MNGAKGHVLITGSAVRIGRVIAVTMAEAGWDITAHYNTSYEEALTLAQAVEQMGRKVTLVQANLEHYDQVEKLIPLHPAYPLTALVNNASLFEHDANDPNGTRHMAVNFEAPCLLTDRLAQQLPFGQTGSVVHILDGTPTPAIMSAYANSRQRLETEMAAQIQNYSDHLRINALVLGPTLINQRQSQEHFDRIAAASPRGQADTPLEVAQAVQFILESADIFGQKLDIDSCMQSFSGHPV